MADPPPSESNPFPKLSQSCTHPIDVAPLGDAGDPLPTASEEESWFTRYILTPMTMISFLLSLFLIDSVNLRRLTSSASAVRQHFHIRIPSFFVRSNNVREGCVTVDGGAGATQRTARNASPCAAHGPAGRAPGCEKCARTMEAERGWHVKKGKIFKMEMVDAFELRRAVVVGMLACGLMLLVSIGLAIGWIGRGWWIRYGLG